MKGDKYIKSDERIEKAQNNEKAPEFYIETYGCQMNVADSELVVSIMLEAGYKLTEDFNKADIVFINTCAIREKAEKRVLNRLKVFGFLKKSKPNLKIGILGCVAERLKEKLLEEEKSVDIVAGPDSYRSLPKLLEDVRDGSSAINVQLSKEETYADISPVRKSINKVSAFISITRGCDNMCAFCVVPFVRGRERSRKPETIIKEMKEVIYEGFNEVTLLGQNVDKYNWNNGELNFAGLLEKVALIDDKVRIRFATSYPQDFTDEVLNVMAKHKNICKYIHLPVQSGSNRILEKMRRGYTREWYIERVNAIRKILPDCSISTDLITGFCSETEDEHNDTLSLMREVKFDYAYMFKYSERPGTYAERKYENDIPEDIKGKRLDEIIKLQNKISLESNKRDLHKTFEVLIEGESKKSPNRYFGRNSQNKVIVFPKRGTKIGTVVNVLVTDCTSATLLGYAVKDKDIMSKIN